MRLVIDALPARRGGLATYVRCLLAAWSEEAPEDDVTVVLTEPFAAEIASDSRRRRHRLVIRPQRRPSAAWWAARSQLLLPRLQGYGDVLLATVPIIPVFWRRPAVAVVHDLRHEDRPADFARTHRLARGIFFNAAYRKADRLLADSTRTANDLAAKYPSTIDRTTVVYLGADHVPGAFSTRSSDAVAFAAKGPVRLLQAWQILKRGSVDFKLRLRIIGCTDAQKEELWRKAIQLGIAEQVQLDSYVDQNDLNRLMGAASALLLPSRFEGFGLPVLEAMRQGVPAMISPDPTLKEVGGGHAACAASWDPSDIAVAIRQALNMTREDLVSARQHADQFTWRRTVRLTRANLDAALASARPRLTLSGT